MKLFFNIFHNNKFKLFSVLISLSCILIVFSSCKKCEFKSITPDKLPNATVGQVNYSAKIDNNSTCTYNTKICTLTNGNLPNFLTLNGDGSITGNIDTLRSVAGDYKITIDYQVCFGSNGYEGTDCHDLTKDYIITVLNK